MNSSPITHPLVVPGARTNARRVIGLRSKRKRVLVPLANIERVEASNNRSQVYTTEGVLLVDESLGHLAARLAPDVFMRVSRSHLVNRDWIVSIRPSSHGDQTVSLRSGVRVRLSRTRRAACLEWFDRAP